MKWGSKRTGKMIGPRRRTTGLPPWLPKVRVPCPRAGPSRLRRRRVRIHRQPDFEESLDLAQGSVRRPKAAGFDFQDERFLLVEPLPELFRGPAEALPSVPDTLEPVRAQLDFWHVGKDVPFLGSPGAQGPPIPRARVVQFRTAGRRGRPGRGGYGLAELRTIGAELEDRPLDPDRGQRRYVVPAHFADQVQPSARTRGVVQMPRAVPRAVN